MAALRSVLRSARQTQLRLQPMTRRALSTSSSSPPPLPGLLPTLFHAGKRVYNKLDALSELDSKLHLFRSDVRQEQMWWMLLQLHMPQHADVDLVEFLEGAKAAAEAQLRAVNSEEFAAYAAGRREESETAEALSSFCNSRTFKGLKQAAKQMLEDRNMLLELQDVDIEAVQVTGIRYAQLTDTQLEALMAGFPHLPTLWAADASVEYLQIHVVMKTTEVTRMTLIGVEEVVAQQTNLRTYKLATRANSDEELAWCIMDTFAINESAKQLSRKVFDEDTVQGRAGDAGGCQEGGEGGEKQEERQQERKEKEEKEKEAGSSSTSSSESKDAK